jgi:hypothetical protein
MPLKVLWRWEENTLLVLDGWIPISFVSKVKVHFNFKSESSKVVKYLLRLHNTSRNARVMRLKQQIGSESSISLCVHLANKVCHVHAIAIALHTGKSKSESLAVEWASAPSAIKYDEQQVGDKTRKHD